MSSSQGPSFGSNNPFRRKVGNPPPSGSDSPAGTPSPGLDGPFNTTPRPPFTTFKSGLPKDEQQEEDPQPAQPKPKKIVKKVRVQSPPPSSPEDAVPVTRFPPQNYDDDDDSSDSRDQEDAIDPFNAAPLDTEEKTTFDNSPPRVPANPFSRTLQDLEQPGQGQDVNTLAAGATKGNLDVDSFKRLLLTGHANASGSGESSGSSGGSTQLHSTLHDGASNTDASSISRQSMFDTVQETPRTSHEISEPEEPEERRSFLASSPLATVQSASTRKKPPPPSSRHGKLIKLELGADSERRPNKDSSPRTSVDTSLPKIAPPRKASVHSITPLQSPSLPTDVNKPLPAPPFHPSAEGEIDSPFDREAAGKLPEAFANLQANPRPPTPPPPTTRNRDRSESYSSIQSRKPAAPPPRRHGRSDSRAPSINTANTDEDPPRSSLDSNRDRADSLRVNAGNEKNINAPIPPPPRRPLHSRQGSSYMSPTHGVSSASPGLTDSERSPLGMGFSPVSGGAKTESLGGLATVTTSKDGLPRLSPPPPPPARQVSHRRPPSVRSIDLGGSSGATRRVSKEKEGGAAPPPPPPPRIRVSSRTSVGPTAPSTGAISQVNPSKLTEGEGDSKQGVEILADLNALQKEVDALMGKYPKTGGS